MMKYGGNINLTTCIQVYILRFLLSLFHQPFLLIHIFLSFVFL
ncbi:hypothetical protein MtrunA17_Chr3g0106671 [Medicago truncatula]|uniref:Transmembrane protein n=1 Tax=Medicago truncatula TaxID=3880 RepID=A0A396ISY0_MEDTR|nr:hypothetical protein MtrunA17_Chr3g0106671 [Medicago truncatula]